MLYTRKGDDGTTKTFGCDQKRISKSSSVAEALGAMDEINSLLGLCKVRSSEAGFSVRIGAHTAIAGCVGIAGSATIGKYCRIGGSAGILGHLQIADHVEIAAFSLIGKSIREAGSYAAIFPFSKTDEWRKNAVHLRHLDDMAKRIKTIEQELESLKRETQQRKD